MIARLNGLEHLGIETNAFRGVNQRLHVFGEAAATVAHTGVDELIADARIAANAFAHCLDVGPQPLGQIGHFVHEADFGCEHAVGCVFGELRTAHIHHDDFVVVAVERRIKLAQQLLGTRVVGADDDAVRPLAVIDCGAFL